VGLRVKGTTFGPILSKFGFSRQVITKNFAEIRQPAAALVVDDETDVTKVTGAFRDYANAPNAYSWALNALNCIYERREIRTGKF
jgi:hypothetical protein